MSHGIENPTAGLASIVTTPQGKISDAPSVDQSEESLQGRMKKKLRKMEAGILEGK